MAVGVFDDAVERGVGRDDELSHAERGAADGREVGAQLRAMRRLYDGDDRGPDSRARAGDGAAFGELTEPYRRELQVHCYRMLGSLEDAEDALQDTLLAAWRGLAAFEGRASLRTWLYQVATRRCLDARRAAARRPAKAWNVPHVQPPEPTRLGEVVWLQPYPDALLDGVPAAPPGPEARYELAESVSLAFVTACQVLPPRQLAVLVLRDVLGFPAAEVAECWVSRWTRPTAR